MPVPSNSRPRMGGVSTLRIATHNVGIGGLLPKLEACLRTWAALEVDIVAVQELHALWHDTVSAIARKASQYGFAVQWAITGGVSRAAGVAIFYRRALVHAGLLSVGEAWRGPRQWWGHVLALPVDWGSHKLLLTNLYVPCGEQRDFLASIMPQLCSLHRSRQLVLVGDFNFVEDPQLDRWHNSVAEGRRQRPPRAPADSSAPPALAAATYGLVDAFRLLHPTRRCYTHHQHTSEGYTAARLDRAYVAQRLQGYVHSARLGKASPSDHRPFVLSLSSAAPPAVRGCGLRRMRMRFWGSVTHKAQFAQWVEEEAAAAPSDQAALLTWWPGFKQRVMTKAAALDCAASLPVHDDAWAASRVAAQALAAAYKAADTGDPAAHAGLQQCRAAFVAAERRVQHHLPPARPDWLHDNERPSPEMTQRLRPHRSQSHIAAVRNQQGELCLPGVQQANVMAAHYARISTAPTPDPQATQQVLAAVAAGGATFTPVQASTMGAAAVQEEEVGKALKHSPSGKAPGLDGIPVELYRR